MQRQIPLCSGRAGGAPRLGTHWPDTLPTVHNLSADDWTPAGALFSGAGAVFHFLSADSVVWAAGGSVCLCLCLCLSGCLWLSGCLCHCCWPLCRRQQLRGVKSVLYPTRPGFEINLVRIFSTDGIAKSEPALSRALYSIGHWPYCPIANFQAFNRIRDENLACPHRRTRPAGCRAH